MDPRFLCRWMVWAPNLWQFAFSSGQTLRGTCSNGLFATIGPVCLWCVSTKWDSPHSHWSNLRFSHLGTNVHCVGEHREKRLPAQIDDFGCSPHALLHMVPQVLLPFFTLAGASLQLLGAYKGATVSGSQEVGGCVVGQLG